MICLIRHASAGDRSSWAGDDRLRPLDDRGLRQAEELVDLLQRYSLDRIVSSPALRCVQTVEPLALARGLPIEVADEIAEFRQWEDGPAFVRSLAGVDAALGCHAGLSDALCDQSQKKGEVLVLDGDKVVAGFRAKGRR
jgi:8-oxo-dGTP diphosphatase